MLVLLMEGFMNYGAAMGLGCHDIHTKSHEDSFWNSKVVREDTTHRQEGDVISLHSIFPK
jgi:hypothetical protein